MVIHLIPKEEAERIVHNDHEDWETVEDIYISQSRWTIKRRVILKYIPTETFYQVDYLLGATELQDDQELFYGEKVKFIEVLQYEATVKQWIVKE